MRKPGEELLPELVDLYRRAKKENWDKPRFLRAAAEIQGVYVPSLYNVSYHKDGAIAAITPLDGAPEKVVKRVVHDMDKSYYPVKTIVPSTEIVHAPAGAGPQGPACSAWRYRPFRSPRKSR